MSVCLCVCVCLDLNVCDRVPVLFIALQRRAVISGSRGCRGCRRSFDARYAAVKVTSTKEGRSAQKNKQTKHTQTNTAVTNNPSHLHQGHSNKCGLVGVQSRQKETVAWACSLVWGCGFSHADFLPYIQGDMPLRPGERVWQSARCGENATEAYSAAAGV